MKKINSQSGFSLIELMIVVAIIGILAAIAIPNYQKFVRKSRQSEANSTLEGIYTAEQAYIGEYGGGTTALDVIGYTPTGRIHYDCGWGAIAAAPAGATAGRVAADQSNVAGTKFDTNGYCVAGNACTVGLKDYNPAGPAALAAGVIAAGGVATGFVDPVVVAGVGVEFAVDCRGNIGGPQDDRWTIDYKKTIGMIQDGT